MKISATLIFVIGVCVCSFSQKIISSRKFESVGRNTPLAIINSRPEFFYLLRYNKVLHDFTVERRSKPNAELEAFSPLRLGEVNADWFNYQKLDYLFFENGKELFFLFEKVLNTKKTIYLKIIDSLHHASGFIELANLNMEKGALNIGFEFKKTYGDNILIVASQTFPNAVYKTAMLFNIKSRKMEWVKKLAIENDFTGYSTAYVCNKSNDLFLALIKSHVASYERKYLHHMQMQIPVVVCETITLMSYLHNDRENIHLKLLAQKPSRLSSVILSSEDDDVIAQTHYAVEDENTKYKPVFFSRYRLNNLLNIEKYATTTNLNKEIEEQLTFYDGSDSKFAGDKLYSPVKNIGNNDSNYMISQRIDEPYLKELLVIQTNVDAGNVLSQNVVIRKSTNAALIVSRQHKLYVIMRESRTNFKKMPQESRYNKLKREDGVWGANNVIYIIDAQGHIDKKLVDAGFEFSWASVKYEGDGQNELIFCEQINGYERFVFYELNPS
jgi:hypothetical protein